ncbi:hypothetical protein GCM10022198_00010 [Klugiella xanthotipulae]
MFIETNCVAVDWKAGISETCWLLEFRFPQHQKALQGSSVAALIKKHQDEIAEDYLPALASSLQRFDLLLCEVEEDSDQYQLHLCAKDDSLAFERNAAEQGTVIKRFKKPSRKRISSQQAPLLEFTFHPIEDENLQNDYAYPISYGLWDIVEIEGQRSTRQTLVDFRPWPPRVVQSHFTHPRRIIRNYDYSSEYGLYCATFLDDSVDTSTFDPISGAPMGGTSVMISADPMDDSAWEFIELEATASASLGCKVAWFGAHLLITNDDLVWIVEDAAHGNRASRELLDTQSRDRDLAGMPSAGGERILSWDGNHDLLNVSGVLLDLGSSSDKYGASCPRVPGVSFNQFSYLSERGRFVVMTRPPLKLFEYEMSKAEETTSTWQLLRSCAITGSDGLEKSWHVTRTVLADGWLMMSSVAFNNSKNKHELALLWHEPTDRWLRIRYGAVGEHEFLGVLQHPDGYILVRTWGGVLRIDNLIEQLEADAENECTQAWVIS